MLTRGLLADKLPSIFLTTLILSYPAISFVNLVIGGSTKTVDIFGNTIWQSHSSWGRNFSYILVGFWLGGALLGLLTAPFRVRYGNTLALITATLALLIGSASFLRQDGRTNWLGPLVAGSLLISLHKSRVIPEL